jgi:hypothetical protein
MKNKGNEQTETRYSPRSQRSLLEERRLEGERQTIDKAIASIARRIEEAEHDKARALKAARIGRGDQVVLGRIVEYLEDKTRVLKAYQEERAAIERQIGRMGQANPEELAKRTERQGHAAKLAAERLKLDERIQGALQALRHSLEERREFTAKLARTANEIELEADLDSRRFEALLAALPENVYAESERWVDWFTAQGKLAKTYVAVSADLTFPESLAYAGVCRFGDQVQLADEQAARLLEDEYPAPKYPANWHYAPAPLMPADEFEVLEKEALKKDIGARELYEARISEREAELREAYLAGCVKDRESQDAAREQIVI